MIVISVMQCDAMAIDKLGNFFTFDDFVSLIGPLIELCKFIC